MMNYISIVAGRIRLKKYRIRQAKSRRIRISSRFCAVPNPKHWLTMHNLFIGYNACRDLWDKNELTNMHTLKVILDGKI